MKKIFIKGEEVGGMMVLDVLPCQIKEDGEDSGSAAQVLEG